MAKKILTVPEMVTKAIEQSGLTRLEFATRCGVSRKTVFHWESGKDSPGYHALLTMARSDFEALNHLAAQVFFNRDGIAITVLAPAPNGKEPGK